MALEQIGLEAVLQDANFQAGVKRYVAGLSQMEGQTNKAAGGMSALGHTMSTAVGSAIGFLTATAIPKLIEGLSGIGKFAFDVAIDYEKSMNMFGAVTGATAAQMAEAGKTAKALGADMELPATSAGGAALAMTELAKAGLSVDDTLKAAKGTLQLAAAGAMTEADAASTAANALNMFSLKGGEATRIADLLAAAANASSAEVKDVSDSLNMFGAVAAASGIKIEEAVAAIAEMANQGIKGSDAGTSLKTMMLALQGPTDKAQGLMQQLGINIYDAKGQMLPFKDIIGIVNKALWDSSSATQLLGGRTKEQNQELAKLTKQYAAMQEKLDAYRSGTLGATMTTKQKEKAIIDLQEKMGLLSPKIAELNGIQGKSVSVTRQLTQEQRNEAMATLFGSDAVRAANIVFGQGVKTYEEAFQAVTKQGAAAELAGARTKGLGGAFAGLKSQLETIALSAAEPLLKPLEDVVRDFAFIVGSPEVMGAIENFGKGISNVIVNIGDFVRAGGGLDNLAVVFKEIGIPPDVTAALLTAVQVIEDVGKAMQSMVAEIAPLWAEAWKNINDAMAEMGISWKDVFGTTLKVIAALVVALIAVLVGLTKAVATMAAAATKTMTAFGKNFKGIIEGIAKIFANWIQAWKQLFAGDFAGALKSAGGVLEGFLQVVTSLFKQMWTFIDATLGTILKGIGAFVTGVIDFFKKLAKELVGGSIIPDMMKNMQDIIISVLNAVKSFIITILNAIADIFDKAFSEMRKITDTAWTAILSLTKMSWEDIRKAIYSALVAIGDQVFAGMREVQTVITSAWNAISALTTSIWAAMRATIDNALNAIQSVITSGMNAINSTITTIWNTVGSITTSAWSTIRTTIDNALSAIQAVVSASLNAVQNVMSSIWTMLQNITSNTWAAISGTISDWTNAIRNVVDTGFRAVQNMVSDAWDSIRNGVAGAWYAITDAIGNAINAIPGNVQWAIDTVIGIGNSIVTTIRAGILDWWGWLNDAIGSSIYGIVDSVGDAVSSVYQIGVGIVNSIRDGISWMWDGITGLISNLIWGLPDYGASVIDSIQSSILGAWDSFVDWLWGLLGNLSFPWEGSMSSQAASNAATASALTSANTYSTTSAITTTNNYSLQVMTTTPQERIVSDFYTMRTMGIA